MLTKRGLFLYKLSCFGVYLGSSSPSLQAFRIQIILWLLQHSRWFFIQKINVSIENWLEQKINANVQWCKPKPCWESCNRRKYSSTFAIVDFHDYSFISHVSNLFYNSSFFIHTCFAGTFILSFTNFLQSQTSYFPIMFLLSFTIESQGQYTWTLSQPGC